MGMEVVMGQTAAGREFCACAHVCKASPARAVDDVTGFDRADARILANVEIVAAKEPPGSRTACTLPGTSHSLTASRLRHTLASHC